MKRAEVKGYAALADVFSRWFEAGAAFHRRHAAHRRAASADDPARGRDRRQNYEQRLTTIDLATNSLTQVTPADMYVYEYDWTPDGQGWVATAAHGSGDANWYVAQLYRIHAQIR